MNVHLTVTHHRTLLRVTAGTTLADVFTRDVRPSTKTGISVAAPYVAWELAVRQLMEVFWTHRPPDVNHVPKHVRIMLRRIAAAQNAFIRHPALKGVAMLGVHSGWFPVWIDDEGRRSPTPTDGRFALLGARTIEGQRKTAFTVWVEGGAVQADHWLAQEQTHTALLG